MEGSSELRQRAWLRALERTASIRKRSNCTFPALLDEVAQRSGPRPALISNRGSFSYLRLAQRARQYTRWALSQDAAPGSVFALLMENQPDYIAAWLGISRTGCTAALLNTNLVGPSLAHCIDIVEASHVIVTAGLANALETALPHLKSKPEVWIYGADSLKFRALDSALESFSHTPLENSEIRPVTISDRALCVYTSGTTGLPKAANVSHERIMSWSHWFAGLMDAGPADRLYDCLPFYHAIGGIAAPGALLASGGSVFIREKFSAKAFWQEVYEQDCTIFQYIGELCRYLLKAPATRFEREHRLRLACGNGLSADVWGPFKERFGIPDIIEFYAATEANFSLYNVEGKPGAIGRIPSFLKHRFPIELIKIDPDNWDPLRNAEGRCISARANEPGEAIFPISQSGKGASSFEGYSRAGDSERKILRNAFAEGDAWYRSGDLMKQGEDGFFYFVDRVGDTFRWKGENVSASEVMQVVASAPAVVEAVVFGVAVPGCDGRAGMAALVADTTLDVAELKKHLDRHLPRYAQPLFLRLLDKMETTGTFRPKKAQLAAQGYDMHQISEPLYFNDHARKQLVPLDAHLYQRIIEGSVSF